MDIKKNVLILIRLTLGWLSICLDTHLLEVISLVPFQASEDNNPWNPNPRRMGRPSQTQGDKRNDKESRNICRRKVQRDATEGKAKLRKHWLVTLRANYEDFKHFTVLLEEAVWRQKYDAYDCFFRGMAWVEFLCKRLIERIVSGEREWGKQDDRRKLSMDLVSAEVQVQCDPRGSPGTWGPPQTGPSLAVVHCLGAL